MYGMIHQAIMKFYIEKRGREAWENLARESNIRPDLLISSEVYPDETTTGFMSAVNKDLGMEMEDCLKIFGRYWVKFAEQGAYGSIMNFTGKTFFEFIENLDRMHHAVVSVMSSARVPSFRILSRDDHSMVIQYRSERVGLESFVTGLIEGLLEKFHESAVVSQGRRRGNAVEFLVEFDSGGCP